MSSSSIDSSDPSSGLLYQKNGFYLLASSAEAWFEDGEQVVFNNVTSNMESKPLGYELILFNNDKSNDRIVKLYFALPGQDWRKNESLLLYHWKLSSAWMSGSNDVEHDWLHWNVENYINSEIKVPSSESINNNNNNDASPLLLVLECNEIKLEFERLTSSGLPRHSILPDNSNNNNKPRLVLHGPKLQIGALLETTNNDNNNNKNDNDTKPPTQNMIYNPCHPTKRHNNNCTFINGKLYKTKVQQMQHDHHAMIFYSTVVFIVGLIFYSCYKWLIYRQRLELYDRIGVSTKEYNDGKDDDGDDESHDLALQVEDDEKRLATLTEPVNMD